jgi:hypothetical protein
MEVAVGQLGRLHTAPPRHTDDAQVPGHHLPQTSWLYIQL